MVVTRRSTRVEPRNEGESSATEQTPVEVILSNAPMQTRRSVRKHGQTSESGADEVESLVRSRSPLKSDTETHVTTRSGNRNKNSDAEVSEAKSSPSRTSTRSHSKQSLGQLTDSTRKLRSHRPDLITEPFSKFKEDAELSEAESHCSSVSTTTRRRQLRPLRSRRSLLPSEPTSDAESNVSSVSGVEVLATRSTRNSRARHQSSLVSEPQKEQTSDAESCSSGYSLQPLARRSSRRNKSNLQSDEVLFVSETNKYDGQDQETLKKQSPKIHGVKSDAPSSVGKQNVLSSPGRSLGNQPAIQEDEVVVISDIEEPESSDTVCKGLIVEPEVEESSVTKEVDLPVEGSAVPLLQSSETHPEENIIPDQMLQLSEDQIDQELATKEYHITNDNDATKERNENLQGVQGSENMNICLYIDSNDRKTEHRDNDDGGGDDDDDDVGGDVGGDDDDLDGGDDDDLDGGDDDDLDGGDDDDLDGGDDDDLVVGDHDDLVVGDDDDLVVGDDDDDDLVVGDDDDDDDLVVGDDDDDDDDLVVGDDDDLVVGDDDDDDLVVGGDDDDDLDGGGDDDDDLVVGDDDDDDLVVGDDDDDDLVVGDDDDDDLVVGDDDDDDLVVGDDDDDDLDVGDDDLDVGDDDDDLDGGDDDDDLDGGDDDDLVVGEDDDLVVGEDDDDLGGGDDDLGGDDDIMEVEEEDEEQVAEKPKSKKASTAQLQDAAGDGLFVIDTAPGVDSSKKYFLEPDDKKVLKKRKSKKASKQQLQNIAEDGLFVIDTDPGVDSNKKYFLEPEDDKEDKIEEGEKGEIPGPDEDDDFIDEDDVDEEETLLNSTQSAHFLSTSIDAGISLKEMGGLYITFDGAKQNPGPSFLSKMKKIHKKDELLQKSVITPDFEKKESIPKYSQSKHQLKKLRKKEREKTTGAGWFDMKAPQLTSELKNDLKALKMRSAMDPKHFYKRCDREGFPKYFQVGTVMDNPADFYNYRIPKKQRKRTIVEELLADVEFRRYNKKKYMEIVSEKAARAASKTNHKKRKFQN